MTRKAVLAIASVLAVFAASAVQAQAQSVDLSLTSTPSAKAGISDGEEPRQIVFKVSNASASVPATGVQVQVNVPTGFVIREASTDNGSFDAGTGRWTLGDPIESGAGASENRLKIGVSHTGGRSGTLTGEISAAGQPDPDSTPGNAATTDEDDEVSIVLRRPTVRWASPTGVTTGQCLTRATACTIERAANRTDASFSSGVAEEFDTIRVLAGTYTDVLIETPEFATIEGDDPNAKPVLDNENGFPALAIAAGGVVRNLRVVSNNMGILLGPSSIGVRPSTVDNVEVTAAFGAVRIFHPTSIRDSFLVATSAGGAAVESQPGDELVDQPGVPPSVFVDGATIIGQSGAGAVNVTSGQLTLTSSIARASGTNVDVDEAGTNSLIVIRYSNFETTNGVVIPGDGNQTSAPAFLDAANGNFRQAAGSPTIDAGTALDPARRDFDNGPRTLGPRADIGADEFDLAGVAKTWDGSESNDWTDPNNWTPSGIPTGADDVTVPAGTPNNPTIPAENFGTAAAESVADVHSIQLSAPLHLGASANLIVGRGTSRLDAEITSDGGSVFFNGGTRIVNHGTTTLGPNFIKGQGSAAPFINAAGASLAGDGELNGGSMLSFLENHGVVTQLDGRRLLLVVFSGAGEYRLGAGGALFFDTGTVTGASITGGTLATNLRALNMVIPAGVLDAGATLIGNADVQGDARAGAAFVLAGSTMRVSGGHLDLDPGRAVVVTGQSFPTSLFAELVIGSGGSVDATTAASFGTVSGSGNAGALTIEGGTVAPTGTLSATSLQTFSGRLAIDVSADGTDKLAVSGPATLESTSLDVQVASGFTPPASARILDATARTGTFSATTGNRAYEVRYDATGADVVFRKTWTPQGGSDDWETAGNWTPSGVPTASDDVAIPAAVTPAPHIDSAAAVNSIRLDGPLSIDAGSLTLGSGTSTLAAAVTTASGTELVVGGEATMAAAFTETGAGGVRVSPTGVLTGIGSPANTFGPLVNDGRVEVGDAQIGGLSGTGTYRLLGGVWVVTGTSTFPTGASVTGTSLSKLVSQGDMTFDGATVFASSSIDLQAGSPSSGGDITINQPIVVHSIDARQDEEQPGTSVITVNATVNTSARSIAGTEGEVRITSAGTVVGDLHAAGGLVTGSGRVTGTLGATAGTIDPTGTLSAGTLNLGASGTLHVDLDGSAFDQLAVTGNATIAGTLEAALAAGYTPAPGTVRRIINTGGTLTGTFATTTVAPFSVRYDATGVELFTAAEQPPVNTVPGLGITTNEDTTYSFSLGQVAVSDPDSPSLSVRLQAHYGTFGVVPSGVRVTGPGTGNMLLEGPPSDINAALSTLTYSPAANSYDNDTVTMTSSDGGRSDVDTFGVTIRPVDDPPVNTVPTGPINVPFQTPTDIDGISVEDIDGGLLSVTVRADHGTFSPSMPISGTQADVNTALNDLKYTPATGYAGPDTITVETSADSAVDTDTVSVVVGNDPGPFNVLADAYSTQEDTDLSFSPQVAGDGQITTTLSVSTGTLRKASGGTAASSQAFGPGTAAEVTSALAGTIFAPSPNASGGVTLTMTSTSASGNASSTRTITVAPIDDAPTFDAIAARTTPQDTAVTYNPLTTVSDIDSTDTAITVSTSHGTVTVGATTASSVPISGTLAAVNAALDGLVYTPPTGFNGTATITVSAAGAQPVSGSVGVGNVGENSPPAVTAPGSATTGENTPLTFTNVSVSDPDAGSNPVKVKLTATRGTIRPAGSATPAAGAELTGSLSTINAALNGMVFTPETDYVGGDASLKVDIDDQGHSGSGGARTASVTIPITVTIGPRADVALSADPGAVGVPIGDSVPVRFTATNDGPQAATGVTATLSVPAGVLITPASTTWSIGDLAAGASTTLTVQARVTSAGPKSLTAAITSAGVRDPDPANDSATSTLTGSSVALAADPGSLAFGIIRPGTSRDLQLKVTNNGSTPVSFSGQTTGGFEIVAPGQGPLGSGASRTYAVRATDGGDESGSLRFTSTGTADPALVVPLSKDLRPAIAAPNITGGPSGVTGANDASFTFTGEADADRFECSLTGRTADTSCPSGKTYSDLADGRYTFSVLQVGADGARSAPATVEFVVDTSAPAGPPTITTGPPATVPGSGTVTIVFGGAEPGGSFECSVDGGPFVACSSPLSLSGLGAGRHSVGIRQVDAAGNRGPAVQVAFEVLGAVASACVSQRNFRVTLLGIKKVWRVKLNRKSAKIVTARIKSAAGTTLRTVSFRPGRIQVDLRNLPKGAYSLEVVIVDRRGKKGTYVRTYRTCAPGTKVS